MRPAGRRAAAGLVFAAALSLAACSSGSPAASPSTSNSATTSAPAVTTAPLATAAPAPTSSITLVPMQTASGGEFLSPTGNISCEVDYNRAGMTQAYCQTGTPPQSVTMDPTGKYRICTGEQCLGNAGINTPTLAYGEATGVGPFLCVSATTGITCTAGGRGFRISRSGITPA